jgi:excisionase family DNA binding protein
MSVIAQHEPDLLTVAEAAALARVSKMTVHRRIREGAVPAVRVGPPGSPVRIPRRAFMAWLYGAPEDAA